MQLAPEIATFIERAKLDTAKLLHEIACRWPAASDDEVETALQIAAEARGRDHG